MRVEKLKPCPFCEEEAIFKGVEGKYGVDRIVECKNCLARGEPCPTKREAIQAWNKRA